MCFSYLTSKSTIKDITLLSCGPSIAIRNYILEENFNIIIQLKQTVKIIKIIIIILYWTLKSQIGIY